MPTFCRSIPARGAKGGRGMNACKRQRKGRGGRGGMVWDESNCYDAAQRKRRCQRYSPLVADILRLFHRLKLDKQSGLSRAG